MNKKKNQSDRACEKTQSVREKPLEDTPEEKKAVLRSSAGAAPCAAAARVQLIADAATIAAVITLFRTLMATSFACVRHARDAPSTTELRCWPADLRGLVGRRDAGGAGPVPRSTCPRV
jgi:hypothetical protein